MFFSFFFFSLLSMIITAKQQQQQHTTDVTAFLISWLFTLKKKCKVDLFSHYHSSAVSL